MRTKVMVLILTSVIFSSSGAGAAWTVVKEDRKSYIQSSNLLTDWNGDNIGTVFITVHNTDSRDEFSVLVASLRSLSSLQSDELDNIELEIKPHIRWSERTGTIKWDIESYPRILTASFDPEIEEICKDKEITKIVIRLRGGSTGTLSLDGFREAYREIQRRKIC